MAEIQQTETTTVHTETRTEAEKSSLLSDILSIIGFAILFIIIIWGLLHLASLSSSWFSSLFYKPAPTIEVSAPSQATSSIPVSVSWTYATSVKGSYAFLYQCKTGLQFATPENSATSTYVGIPCGAAYTVGSQNNMITIAPVLSGTSSVTDTISIVFIPQTGGSQVQGDATMTINPGQVAVAPAAPAKPVATKPTATYTAPQYSGPADLSVRIISASVDQTGAGTVSFDIANVGGSPSGNYSFTATLPIQSSYSQSYVQSYGGTMQGNVFVSPSQTSLTPGSHIVNTLRFTEAASGGGAFSVTVNSNDADYGNNSASTQIVAPYNTGYNYNTNYNPAPYTVYPTTYPTYTY
jgi:hypothetical protein